MLEARFGVVIINWNGADDTIAALESLVAAQPRPDHVVVVDNGSADDSVARLRKWCTVNAPSWSEAIAGLSGEVDPSVWLLLISAGSNLGFSGGNNIGLKWLAGQTDVSHLMLLNNDAMIAPDFFAHVASAIRDLPGVGLLGSLIYRHPERDRVWYSGAVAIPWRALVLHRVDTPVAAAPYPTPFVTGCAMIISRPLYEAEGGLVDDYNPIYWEDADYSYRAHARGWQVVVVPCAHVYHRVGASGGGELLTPRTAFFQNRNRAIYVRRNYRGLDRIIALGYLTATKPARALVELARGRGALGSAIFRGFWRGVTQALG